MNTGHGRGIHGIAAESAENFASGSKESLRIFLVENHTDSRNILSMLLQQMGYLVEAASSVGEALERLPAAHCDVLISDIGLPDGNGWELLSRLGDDKPPYALAMSGFGMNADREKSKSAGYRHHLVKPMDFEKLNKLLHEAAQELEKV